MRAQAELQQFLAQLDAGHEAQVAQAKQLLQQQQERQEAAARAAAEEEQRQAELAAEHEQLTLEDLRREAVRLSQVGSQWLCCPDRTAIVLRNGPASLQYTCIVHRTAFHSARV